MSMSDGSTPVPAEVAMREPQQRKRLRMTPSEFYVYVVALMCGISMMMPVNSVFSAPSYITTYYLYATKDPNHVPVQTNFWSNVMTYYNLISMVTSLIMEPLTLLKGFRRIPMLVRLLGGLIILIVEIIVLMTVPARGTSENGAVATVCMAGFIGGFGKSIFESTVYGMFGAFPPSFTSTMMGGVGISGALTSLIQIIVKAALPDTYEGVKKQSYIYYGLDVGIQGATFVALILLRFNSFARQHFGDLGGVKSKVDAGSLAGGDVGDHLHRGGSADELNDDAAMMMRRIDEAGERQATGQEAQMSSSGQPETVAALRQASQKADEQVDALVMKEDPLADQPIHDLDGMEEGLAGGGGAAGANGAEGPTSNELLLSTPIFETLKLVKWMFVACGFNFLITLFLFPSIATGMFPNSKWYATVAVFIFNITDVFGRFSPSLKFMWPRSYNQRWIIVAASFARVIFVPLLLLHSYHYIPSEAYGYVMEVIFGYSNGFVGSMALILGPQSRGVDNDGKRFVAGTLMGISILIGGTIGTVFSIMTQTVREKY